MTYQPTPQEEKLIKKVLSRYTESKAAIDKGGWVNKWNRWYGLLKNKYSPADGDKRQYGKDVSIPEAVSQFETAFVKIANPLLSPGVKLLHVIPLDENSLDAAPFMEHVLSYYYDKINFSEVLYDIIFNMMVFGTCIVKASWHREVKTVKNEFREAQVQIVDEHPFLEIVDLENYYDDPEHEAIEKKRYCMHIRQMHRDEILEMMENGFWDKRKKRYLDKELLSSIKLQDVSKGDVGDRYRISGEDTFEVCEYYERGRLVVIVNWAMVVRDSSGDSYPFIFRGKPYYPFFKFRYKKVAKESFGVSFFADLEDFQYSLNVLWNNLLDNLAITVRPPIIADNNLVEEEDRDMLTIDVAKVITKRPDQSYEVLRFPSIVRDTINMIEICRRVMMQRSSATDQMQGLPSSGPEETASAYLQRQQAAQSKFDNIFRNLLRELERLWGFISDLIIKFQVNTISVLNQDKIMHISKDLMAGRFKIKVEVDPFGTAKNLKIEQLKQLYEAASKRSDMDSKEILDRLLTLMEVPKKEEILLTPEEQFNKLVEQQFIQMAAVDIAKKMLSLNTEAPPQPIPPKEEPPPPPISRKGAIDTLQDLIRATSPKAPRSEF